MSPRRGAIAKCSLGGIGLITCDEPQKIKFSDNVEGLVWTGVYIKSKELANRAGEKFTPKIGDPWASRTPEVLGYIQDLNIEEFCASFTF